MIEVNDIVGQALFSAPEPFVILRSQGSWVPGGFGSTVTSIVSSGPVQRATDKEIDIVPEADRVNGVMAFWSLIPIYPTRGAIGQVQAVQQVIPQGVYPGFDYVLDPVPPNGVTAQLYKNRKLLLPGTDYTLNGANLALTYETAANDSLFMVWTNPDGGLSARDQIQYADQLYTIFGVRHYPGSGYWKAVGARESTI